MKLKRLRIALSAVALSGLIFPTLAFAQNVTVSGTTGSVVIRMTVSATSRDYILTSGSGATTVSLLSSTFSATIPASTSFTVRSNDRLVVSHTGGSDSNFSETCNSSYYELTSTAAGSAITVSFEPLATICTTPGATGGTGSSGTGTGGGGGGGGATPAPAPTTDTSTKPTSTTTTSGTLNENKIVTSAPTAEIPYPSQSGVVNTSSGVSNTHTTISVVKPVAVASPTQSVTVKITLKKDADNLVAGKTVVLTSSKTGDVITPAEAKTDVNGEASFTVKSALAGASVLSVKVDGSKLAEKAAINFQAQAPKTEIKPNDLVKMACSAGAGSDNPCRAVYSVGSDGYRHPFPQDKVYFSWHKDFSGIKQVSSAELSSLPLGKSVPMRFGTKLVMVTGESSVYAVEPGGILRKITSEQQAKDFYGSGWAKRVVDLPSSLFAGAYIFGDDLRSGEAPTWLFVKGSDGKTYQVSSDHKLREVADVSGIFKQIGFKDEFVVNLGAKAGTIQKTSDKLTSAKDDLKMPF